VLKFGSAFELSGSGFGQVGSGSRIRFNAPGSLFGLIMSVVLLDQFQRPLRNLRLSVTDRCNLSCSYCMPEPEYVWLPREDILQFEEIERLVDTFLDLGVDKVRLTGGEPLLRRHLPTLIERLAARSRIRDLAMTTNGILLAEHVSALADAGLHRLTVSLDTLHPDRFQRLTRSSELHRVLDGIAAAAPLFPGLKIDTVVMRGTNEDELSDLVEFGSTYGAEVRFIEYMDVGGATHWSMDRVVTRAEMLGGLAQRYGDIQAVEETSSAPADRYRLPDGTIFGIISSTTEPFCEACDRSRLTADGMWYLCLYASRGIDLRAALRGGVDPAGIAAVIRTAWEGRHDRGAETRLASRDRAALIPIDTLRRDPHLEMHTRGG
jgi:cyclic pyranopterin phosphate synthase